MRKFGELTPAQKFLLYEGFYKKNLAISSSITGHNFSLVEKVTELWLDHRYYQLEEIRPWGYFSSEEKHQLLKGFFEGKAVQYFNTCSRCWEEIGNPLFLDDQAYRLKPND